MMTKVMGKDFKKFTKFAAHYIFVGTKLKPYWTAKSALGFDQWSLT